MVCLDESSKQLIAETRVQSKSRSATIIRHLGLALLWAPGLFIWLGDLRKAQEHAEWAAAHAQIHALGPYIAVVSGYKGALAIRCGDAQAGVWYLAECLEQLACLLDHLWGEVGHYDRALGSDDSHGSFRRDAGAGCNVEKALPWPKLRRALRREARNCDYLRPVASHAAHSSPNSCRAVSSYSLQSAALSSSRHRPLVPL